MRTSLLLAFCAAGLLSGADDALTATPTFRQYCFGCHGKAAAMAGVNLEQLTAQPSVGDSFQHWQKVATALEQKRMPPAKMRQPSDAERTGAVTWIRARLNEYAEKHAGDPGRVTVRRLTSGEYTYTIRDLTGLDLRFDRDFAGDSVGGEGFTNFGDVQFMADANLERYLEAAKRVADHAVIGSGPLQFFSDPGKSGLELSAISRIQDIYRSHGFRANSGEGGKPYGMDRYTKAFYVCWLYQHRAALGEANATLSAIAGREGVSPRFAQHLWTVLHQPTPSYPTSDVLARWRSLPAPAGADRAKSLASARAASAEVMRAVVDWPRWFFAAGGVAEGGEGDERSLALGESALQPASSFHFKYNLRTRGKQTTRVYFSLVPVNPPAESKPTVVWHNASVRLRGKEKGFSPAVPLRTLLDEATMKRLGFGKRADGEALSADDFAMAADGLAYVDISVPEGTQAAELQVDVQLAAGKAGDAALRCTVSDNAEVSKGRPLWVLLGDASNPGFQAWQSHVLEFAKALPQNSQGEATPADKDPIPYPFNTAYNQPERDHYHLKVKYYRDDRFLVEHVLDDATRIKLEQAWTDLLGSFEYHNVLLRFAAEKFHVDLQKKGIAELTEADIQQMPPEPRKYVRSLRVEYDAVQKALRAARPGQLEDCLQLASKAWRRPLTEPEKTRLRAFYTKIRTGPELDHAKAIRSLLARVLIAPAFLYRLEQPAQQAGPRALSDWEVASRLSYFLWSSIPDNELRRAAAAGELSDPRRLQTQVKRMIADPKARRFSTEFFGQWLGFYRFDQYRGVDNTRFPEFTEEVKSDMYDEAVSFFEHVVRKDRPVREILTADYTFLTKALAKHYGVTKEVKATTDPELVEGANAFQRGGLLRLGAVLTATSAPLRTSPVKRGDWVLRRILGTPTPPPPADAGSIPADDKLFSGQTVRERLAAHQRNATCAGCHARIDPMGFPLEHYDPVGRWREKYADGKPIHDSATSFDKKEVAGVDGLLQYLHGQEEQVLRTMSYKLLGYALGRTVLASDQQLVDRLTKAGGDATFSQMLTEIATSKQFRYRREREESIPAAPTRQMANAPAVAIPEKKEGGL